MKYNIAFDITNHYSKIYHDFCLIGGIFEQGDYSPIIKKIDSVNNGYITSILHKNRYTGKIGETFLLHHIPNNTPPQNILLVGCGNKNNLDKKKFRKIIYESIKILKKTNIQQIISFLTELNVNKCNNYWKIRYAIEIIQNISYNFTKFKKNTNEKYQELKNIIFYINTLNEFEKNQQAITDGIIISRNINIAKDLGNMPPNICNSKYLIKESQKLEKLCNNTTVQIIDENHMKKLGMNAYLAVGQASKNPSLISIIQYSGSQNKKSQPIVLVGKGVTFDSGGISIKPSDKMDEMKYDMCGAAAVYSILRTAIQLNLQINLIGVLATCENMIANSALRPGDVLKTLSGQTVEIKNTDAEGRLILCDVLTYILQFNPKIIIDIATLTGACVVALGHHFTGLISNSDSLADELIQAGEETNDRVWRLPLDNEFKKQLHSHIADIKNTGGGAGSTITAGAFLEKFVNKNHWAHLDIAGTAWTSKNNQHNATGRPVSMIIQFLINYIKNIPIKNITKE